MLSCFPGPIEIPACITVLFIGVDTFPYPIGILEIHVQNPILLGNSQGLWATRIQLKKTDKQKLAIFCGDIGMSPWPLESLTGKLLMLLYPSTSSAW